MFQCLIYGRLFQDQNSSELNENGRDPIKELTNQDVVRIRQSVADELTPDQFQQFGEILSKLKKGARTRDRDEGKVRKYPNLYSI